eukprot:gene6870-9407_t
MFSPKSYVLELIKNHLSDWVDIIEEDSLNIGLFDGDAQLSNVVLKRKSWAISQAISLSMEHGEIENLQLQIPWSKLHSGQINLLIENIHLVFKVNLDDFSSRPKENLSDDIKEKSLLKQELRLLGANPSISNQSRFSRFVGGMIKSAFSKIASKFTLVANNISISLLIPLSPSECVNCHIRLDNIVMNEVSTKLPNFQKPIKNINTNYVIAKDISVRLSHVSVNIVPNPVNKDDFVQFAVHVMAESKGIILNPANFYTKLWGVNNRRNENDLFNIDGIIIHSWVQNIEISPSYDQLSMIKQALTYIESERANFRLQSIRSLTLDNHLTTPTLKSPSSSIKVSKVFNAKELWKFAINSVIGSIKEKRHKFRKEYLYLYQIAMVHKLCITRAVIPPSLEQRFMFRFRSSSSAVDERSNDSDESISFTPKLDAIEEERFRELQRFFSLADLILFRATVHQQLRNSGVTVKALRRALLNVELPASEVKKSNWSFFGPSNTSDAVQDDDDPAFDVEHDGNNFSFEFEFSLSRLAISLFDYPHQRSTTAGANISHNATANILKKSRHHHGRAEATATKFAETPSLRQLVSLVVYGSNCSLSLSSEFDRICSFSIQAIKSFGHKGEEVLSCGVLSDDWSGLEECNPRVSSLDKIGKAMTATIQLSKTVRPVALTRHSSIDLNPSENESGKSHGNEESSVYHSKYNNFKNENVIYTRSSSTNQSSIRSDSLPGKDSDDEDDGGVDNLIINLIPVVDKHVVVEAYMGQLRVDWNYKTAASITHLFGKLDLKELSLDENRNADLKLRCAKLSMNRSGIDSESSIKFSFDLTSDGITLIIPLVAYNNSHASHFGDHNKHKFPISKSSGSYLRFSIGKTTLQSGDHLENFISNAGSVPMVPSTENIINNEEEPTHMRQTTQKMVRDLIVNVRSSIVKPFVFHLSNIEIGFVEILNGVRTGLVAYDTIKYPKERFHSITLAPWSFYGVISPNDISPHYHYTDTRVDLFCSPLSIGLQSKDVIHFIDVIKEISEVVNPMIDSSKGSGSRIRIKRLAKLSSIIFDVTIDSFELLSLEESNELFVGSFRNIICNILRTCGVIVKMKGVHSFAARERQNIAIRQLSNFEMPKAMAETIVKQYLYSCSSNHLDLNADDDTIFSQIDALQSKIITDIIVSRFTPHTTLCIALRQASFMFHGFTYDHKLLFSVENCSIFDSLRLPLLQLDSTRTSPSLLEYSHLNPHIANVRQNDAGKKKKSNTRRNSRFNNSKQAKVPKTLPEFSDYRASHADSWLLASQNQALSSTIASIDSGELDERTTLDSFNIEELWEKRKVALVFRYVECDTNNLFGQGGHSVEWLSKTSSREDYADRDGFADLRASHLELLVASDRLLAIANSMCHAVSVINSHYHAVFSHPTSNKPQTPRSQKVPLMSFSGSGDVYESNTSLQDRARSPKYCCINDYIHVPLLYFCSKCELKSLSVTLSHAEHLITTLSLDYIELTVDDLLQVASRFAVCLNIGAITMLDLSDLGSIHSEVIWKKRDEDSDSDYLMKKADSNINNTSNYWNEKSRNKMKLNSMVKAVLNCDDSNSYNIIIDVTGLRVCFLFRFLLEIMDYIHLSLITPLSTTVEKFRTNFDNIDESILKTPPNEMFLESFSSDNDSSDSYLSNDEYLSDSDSNLRYRHDRFDKDEAIKFKSGSDFVSPSVFNNTTKSPFDSDYHNMFNSLPKANRNHPSEEKNGVKFASDRAEINKSKPLSFKLIINVTDLSCIAPRNSTSRDLTAATVTEATVIISFEDNHWELPPQNIPSDNSSSSGYASPHLFFDLESNSWRNKQINRDDFNNMKSNIRGSYRGGLEIPSELEFNRFSKKMSVEDPTDDGLYYDAAEGEFDRKAYTTGKADILQHAIDETRSIRTFEQANPIPVHLQKSSPSILRISINLIGARVFVSLPGPYDMTSFKNATRVDAAYLLHDPIIVDSNEHKHFREVRSESLVNVFLRKGIGNIGTWSYGQKWKEVTLTKLNLLIVIDVGVEKTKLLFSDTSELSNIQVTAAQSEFCMLLSVWFDNIFENPKIVANTRFETSGSSDFSGFGSNESGFGSPDKPDGKEKGDKFQFERESNTSQPGAKHMESKLFTSESSDTEGEPVTSHSKFDKYGTPAYFHFLRDRLCSFELVVVRAETTLDCLIDDNYFSRSIPSSNCLAGLQPYPDIPGEEDSDFKNSSVKFGRSNSNNNSSNKSTPQFKLNNPFKKQDLTWQNHHLPIAKIMCSGLLFHLQSDADVLQLSMSCGELEIHDTRIPEKCFKSLALRIPTRFTPPEEQNQPHLSQQKRVYGKSDFDFGLSSIPGEHHLRNKNGLPFQIGMLSSVISNWMTINIGVDKADLDIFNLELFNLINEYFSCYFRFPEYGHPSLLAYHKLPLTSIPYGGVDTRLFITRPHIAILKSPENPDTQSLILETDKEVFFRYIVDTDSTVKLDLKMFNLAAIILKKYRLSDLSRGIRGAAGSGRGVRTLVESLTFALAYYHSAIDFNSSPHLDLKFVVFSSDDETCDRNDLDFENPDHGEIVKPFIRKGFKTGDSVGYINLQDDHLQLEPAKIPQPHCVFPMTTTETNAHLPKNCCKVVTCYEDLLFCTQIVTAFLDIQPKSTTNTSSAESVGRPHHPEKRKTVALVNPIPTFFGVISINSVRIMVVDNVLGLHLPLLQFIAENVQCTIDRSNHTMVKNSIKRSSSVSVRNTANPFVTGGKSMTEIFPNSDNQTVMIFVKAHLWMDYFNNMKKCWEPLLEKLVATVLLEESEHHGKGITIRTSSAIHMNISGAFFRTLNDLLQTIHNNNNDNDGLGNMHEKADIFSADNQMIDSPTKTSTKKDARLSKGVVRFDESELPIRWGQQAKFIDGSLLRGISFKPRYNLNQAARRGSAFSTTEISAHFRHNASVLEVDHLPPQPLADSFRVGFSIQNLTGQPVRYLQEWEDNKKTVQYINSNERGLLNFVASNTLISNNEIVEVAFDVQNDKYSTTKHRNKKLVGNRVALQVSGYQWLPAIQADELSVRFQSLKPVLGKLNYGLKHRDWVISNALKLITEVIPFSGGRMLRLRSVFTIKNNTRHNLNIRCNAQVEHNVGDVDKPFYLKSGENLFIPLSLLQRSARESGGRSLGTLFLQPSDLTSIEEEIGKRSTVRPGSVDYTTDPIDLYKTAAEEDDQGDSLNSPSGWSIATSNDRFRTKKLQKSTMQLYCTINPKTKKKNFEKGKSESVDVRGSLISNDLDMMHSGLMRKLPPFCYCVEVQRHRSDEHVKINSRENRSLSEPLSPNGRKNGSALLNDYFKSPMYFTIVIHPPIILENLLPIGATFELVHATRKQVLWSSWIAGGTAKPVHTVTLEEPLLLYIKVKYCRTDNGILIHQASKGVSDEGFAELVQKKIIDFLEENEGENDSVILTDSVGQKLRLNIENTEGGGGQRHVAIYCPYWIVNTTQYSYRIREDISRLLPAGSVTPQLDGSRPLPGFVNEVEEEVNAITRDAQTDIHGTEPQPSKFRASPNKKFSKLAHPSLERVVFPGQCGQLHGNFNKEIAGDSPLNALLQELSFSEIASLSYMFNYLEDESLLSKRKVSIQLDDSDWSRPFSLDSVGVNQILSINNAERGNFEIGFKISSAPGRLAKYTKIVRFLPRYIINNDLNCGLKILQPTGVAGEMFESDMSSKHVRPFHLPITYGERQLALQVDGPWHCTVPFDIDQVGTFIIQAKRKLDLASIRHVNTRGDTEYTVLLPPNKRIGIYFETDWKEENIVVKDIQKGSHAANETDIQIGDVLMAINEIQVTGNQFVCAMEELKNVLKQDYCIVKFQTLEEKIRIIRESALANDRSVAKPERPTSLMRGIAPNKQHTMHRGSLSMYVHDHPTIHSRGASLSLASPADIEALRNGHMLANRSKETDSSESKLVEMNHNNHDADVQSIDSNLILKVELKQIDSSIMISVKEHNLAKDPEYRIENKSPCYLMHYKQRGIAGNQWMTLKPGQSTNYVWEDPFKPHKLIVFTGKNLLCPGDQYQYNTKISNEFGGKGSGEDRFATIFGYLPSFSSDQTVVNFDEIGTVEQLPIFNSESKLFASVKSVGPTKSLIFSTSIEDSFSLVRELQYCVHLCEFQIGILETVLYRLERALIDLPSKTTDDLPANNLPTKFLSELKIIVEDVGIEQLRLLEMFKEQSTFIAGSSSDSMIKLMPVDETAAKRSTTPASHIKFSHVFDFCLTSRHQLSVSVLAAKDLMPLVVGKNENTYCKIHLKSTDPRVLSISGYRQSQFTYICEDTLDPIWIDQHFLFLTPDFGNEILRHLKLKVVVMANSMFGFDQFLGEAEVQFLYLKDEKVLEGWFPLRPAKSSINASVKSFNVTGSIKLRLQWIHSDIGFAKYIISSLDSRVLQLKQMIAIQRAELKSIAKLESNSNKIVLSEQKLGVLSGGNSGSSNSPPAEEELSNLAIRQQFRLFKQGSVVKFFEFKSDSADDNLNAVTKKKRFQHKRRSSLQGDQLNPGNDVNHLTIKVDKNATFNGPRSSITLRNVRSNSIGTGDWKFAVKRSNTSDNHSSVTKGISAGNVSDSDAGETVSSAENGDYKGSSASSEVGDVPVVSTSSAGKRRKSRSGGKSKRSSYFKPEMNNFDPAKIEVIPGVSAHDSIIFNWANKSQENVVVHNLFSRSMDRPKKVVRQNVNFVARFFDECKRSFHHIHSTNGWFEITPIQAWHLPSCKAPMFAKISYGDESFSTFSMSPASYLTWYQEPEDEANQSFDFDQSERPFSSDAYEGAELNSHYHTSTSVNATYGSGLQKAIASDAIITNKNNSLVHKYKVDTLNVKGNIRVRIMSENYTKNIEVASLDIAVHNLLDCTCILEKDLYYDRWFPLLPTSETIPAEGEMENFKQSSLSEQSSYNKFEYQPCIRLRIRWIPDGDSSIYDSRKYARLQIPSFSLGVIDSEHAREVMEISINGIEFKYSETLAKTDTSLNITWMQVDNQLPDPIEAVIVSPTQKKYPQPAVRLHLVRNNILSQPGLTSYETIQLAVQELDLKLEQQTVIASWELLKTWLQERRTSNSNNNRVELKHVDGKTPGIDSLGFVTCMDTVQYELLPTLSTKQFEPSSLKRSRPSFVGSSFLSQALVDESAKMDEKTNKLYIESFQIFPVKLNVSFITNSSVQNHDSRKEHQVATLNQSADGFYSSIGLFMWQVGEVVLDLTSTISDAPIYFNGFQVVHMFKTDSDVFKILQEHYLHSALGQLYKIVGSLDLVGNPIGLLSSLGVGVIDFFYEPAHALITTPTELRKIGRGVVKGTVSLVSNTAVGFVGTGVTLSRVVGRAFEKLSVDNSYMRARERLQQAPKTLRGTILRPIKDIGNGFYYGPVGLVRIPAYRIKKHGLKGLVPGVAEGVAGLVANPILGILDAFAHSGDAVRDLAKVANKNSVDPVLRCRFSDLFGPDGRILRYNFPVALGNHILKILDFTNENKGLSRAINGGIGVIYSNIFHNNNQESFKGNQKLDMNRTRSRRNSSSVEQHTNRRNKYRSSLISKSTRSDNFDIQIDELNSPSETKATFQEKDTYPEFVVHTTVIRKGFGLDVLAILSTKRLVITEYQRKSRGNAYLKPQWECDLKYLNPPIFERTVGSGATITFSSSKQSFNVLPLPRVSRMQRSTMSHNKNAPSDTISGISGYTLDGNYQEEEVLINLLNCINVAMINNYNSNIDLMPLQYAKKDCEEFEDGVYQIGPWQYLRTQLEDSNLTQNDNNDLNQKLIEELDSEEWANFYDETAYEPNEQALTLNNPSWLIEEQRVAIKSHAQVAEMAHRCKLLKSKYSANNRSNVSDAFQWTYSDFMNGLITFEELLKWDEEHDFNDVDENSVASKVSNVTEEKQKRKSKGLFKSKAKHVLTVSNNNLLLTTPRGNTYNIDDDDSNSTNNKSIASTLLVSATNFVSNLGLTMPGKQSNDNKPNANNALKGDDASGSGGSSTSNKDKSDHNHSSVPSASQISNNNNSNNNNNEILQLEIHSKGNGFVPSLKIKKSVWENLDDASPAQSPIDSKQTSSEQVSPQNIAQSRNISPETIIPFSGSVSMDYNDDIPIPFQSNEEQPSIRDISFTYSDLKRSASPRITDHGDEATRDDSNDEMRQILLLSPVETKQFSTLMGENPINGRGKIKRSSSKRGSVALPSGAKDTKDGVEKKEMENNPMFMSLLHNPRQSSLVSEEGNETNNNNTNNTTTINGNSRVGVSVLAQSRSSVIVRKPLNRTTSPIILSDPLTHNHNTASSSSSPSKHYINNNNNNNDMRQSYVSAMTESPSEPLEKSPYKQANLSRLSDVSNNGNFIPPNTPRRSDSAQESLMNRQENNHVNNDEITTHHSLVSLDDNDHIEYQDNNDMIIMNENNEIDNRYEVSPKSDGSYTVMIDNNSTGSITPIK